MAYNSHHIDPPDDTNDDLDMRVSQMASDPREVRAWLNEAMEDEGLMQKLSILLTRTFDRDGNDEANEIRLDLVEQCEAWCRENAETDREEPDVDARRRTRVSGA